MRRLTNDEFANTNRRFAECCINADVKGTRRQASKFRNKKGLAYKEHLRLKQLEKKDD